MPRVRDLLYRFRPAGTPGAPGPTGVPVDRAADGAAELEPVLHRLAEVERRCDELLAAARRDVEQMATAAAEEAGALVREARARAGAERADAAARVRSDAQEDRAATVAEAEREATVVRRRGEERADAYVEAVVERVRGLLGDEQPAVRRPAGSS